MAGWKVWEAFACLRRPAFLACPRKVGKRRAPKGAFYKAAPFGNPSEAWETVLGFWCSSFLGGGLTGAEHVCECLPPRASKVQLKSDSPAEARIPAFCGAKSRNSHNRESLSARGALGRCGGWFGGLEGLGSFSLPPAAPFSCLPKKREEKKGTKGGFLQSRPLWNPLRRLVDVPLALGAPFFGWRADGC